MPSPPQAGSGPSQPASHPYPSPYIHPAPISVVSLTPSSSAPAPPEVTMVPVASAPQPSSSFKDKLIAGSSPSPSSEDEFVEQDDDITAFHTPEGPVVKLSNRYRSMLHKRWAYTLIVKLWGRTIGFRSLCNKLPNLWSLKEGVKVVDLANNFYFVRFSNRQDYMHALADGPWIVFDHCLTIPELSCEYYDRRLLYTVCNMIGRLVKIDYNTQEAIRGRYARVAIELDLKKPLQSQVFVDSHIMANCPGTETSNFPAPGHQTVPQTMVVPSPSGCGPANQPRGEWMVAAPRKRRPPRNGLHPPRKETLTGKEIPPTKSVNGGNNSGSRFDVLMDYQIVARPTPQIKEPTSGQPMETAVGGNKFSVLMSDSTNMETLGMTIPSVKASSPALSVSSPSLLGASNTAMESEDDPCQPEVLMGGPMNMEVSISAHTPPPTTQLVPETTSSSNLSGNKQVKTVPTGHDTVPTHGQPPSRMQSFTRLLENISLHSPNSNSMETSFDTNGLGHRDLMDVVEKSDKCTAQDEQAQPVAVIVNLGKSAAPVVGSDATRSAGSAKFRRALKEIARAHNPNILVLLETWVEFARVAPFLQALEFDGYAFVDPIGFSGGIWVLWKQNSVQVDVIANDGQFIHMNIQAPSSHPWLFTAVYASPRAAPRDALWSALSLIASSTTHPWMLAGDFNVIADPSKRQGVPLSRSPVNTKFVNFIDQCNLLDLGFADSIFTWERGGTWQP
ncbi:hypothetical protein Tsubulata_048489 [Turnera subulata]|uniref:DUF4283 domain-containing protein n=1 Tax=Turnera subulata TaxID=218843 RepID=A0A9Q0G0N9_9ROSI|nr:hypothetical protein Tsubulata_048489 [Turnera subulata]